MSIEIKNVSKRFGETEALKDVSMTFESGKIYGLLGNNGAGKSTLMNLISGRMFPTAGELLVDGERATENDRALGRLFLMSEANLFPEDMRVKTAFDWAARFYPGFDGAEAVELDVYKRQPEELVSITPSGK